jgi:hypothetical protein
VGPWPLFQFTNLIHSRQDSLDGDQPVARPQPTHRTTQTQNKYKDISASSGSRTHDLSVGVGVDSSCLRPHGSCDRRSAVLCYTIVQECYCAQQYTVA